MLKRLYVDNIRCLTAFEFRPGNVAALVGPNGGGKSTLFFILNAMQAVLSGGNEVHPVFNGTRTRWDSRFEQRIELDVIARDGTEYSYVLVLTQAAEARQTIVHEETLRTGNQLLYRFLGGEVQLFGDRSSAGPRATFPFVPARSFLPLLESRPDNQLIMGFRQWISGLWLFCLQPQVVTVASESEARALAWNGNNFVSWYRMLAQEQPDVVAAWRAEVKPLVPGLREIRLVSIGEHTKVMALECDIGGKTFSLSVGELSDGQRALLILYAIKHVVTKDATVIVLDEPDNYLAAAEIQPWLSGLRDQMVQTRSQTLLVISHHPEVIDYLAPDQILKLWRTPEGPTRLESREFDRTTGVTASEALQLEAP